MEHEEIAGLAGMMMEWIQIGPMLLRLEWLVFFVGGGLGMALSRWLAIKKKLEPAWDLDIILQAIAMGMLVWKLSAVILEPSLFLKYHWTIVYLPPSGNGDWLGVLIALVYLGIYFFRLKKRMRRGCLDLSGILMGVVLAVNQWIRVFWDGDWSLQWIHLPAAVLHSMILYWLWRQGQRKMGTGEVFADFLAFSGLVLFAGSFPVFHPDPGLFFVKTEWLGFFMTIAGLILYLMLDQDKGENRL
jgi:hypothetical protein